MTKINAMLEICSFYFYKITQLLGPIVLYKVQVISKVFEDLSLHIQFFDCFMLDSKRTVEG